MRLGERADDRRPSRLDGALAGGVALALLWAIWRVAPAITFAPLALGDRLIRMTPSDVSGYLIQRLGHDAQRLAATGTTILLVVIAAGLARRLPPAAAAAGVALLLVSAALADPVGGATTATIAAALGAAAAYALILGLLRARPVPGPPRMRRSHATSALSRREALGVASTTLAGLVGIGVAFSGAASPHRTARLRAAGRATSDGTLGFPAVPGLSDAITSVEDHYIVDIDLSDPLLDARSWRLRVDGLVGRPLRMGFDELQRRLDVVEQPSVLTCISNEVGGPLVGCSSWRGVRLADLLALAGPDAHATGIALHCADGYSVGLPMWAARHASTLVALAQNGAPLTRSHGFPCRVRVPALYGMMNAKWVERISVIDHDFRGYWQRQGWAPDAQVRTQSRIDVVDAPRVGGTGVIAGVAWAGIRGVRRVEVTTDAGRTWRDAELSPASAPWVWRAWTVSWTPTEPGEHVVACRATDGRGHVQDPRSHGPRPSGATGLHRRRVSVRGA